jgi:mannose-6-phosphate isomerase-like protein (cupin superfamily)
VGHTKTSFELLDVMKNDINNETKEVGMKSIISIFTLLVISSSCNAKVTQGMKEVVLENDTVEVVRLTYPIGTESGMHQHQHPNRVVYVVKGGKLALVSADNQTKVINILEGQALFLPASKHNVKNVGKTEIVLIETEIKAPATKKIKP